MSSPVVALRTMETVSRIKQILDDPNSHNGFPIVDDYDPNDVSIHNTVSWQFVVCWAERNLIIWTVIYN